MLQPLWLAVDLFAALLLARAVAAKLADLAAFEGVLDAYRLLPFWSLPAAKLALPAAESAISAALIIPSLQRLAGFAAAGLLGLFALAMAINIARGRKEIDCGCGGKAQSLGWSLVVRNLLIAGALVVASILGSGENAWLSVPLAAIAAAASFLLYLGLETLTALPKRAGPKQGLLEMTHTGPAHA